METLVLLDQAQAAGLAVHIDGDELVVCGPPDAEPLALALLERKTEVLAALATAPPVDLEHQGWNAGVARALVGALWRRVGGAWNATPGAMRPVDALAALQEPSQALWQAWERCDLPELRRCICRYEQAAVPIFTAWQSSRQPQEEPTA
jgi:hypothetical protein